MAPQRTVNLYFLYDHERASPNRASGHLHFLLQAKAGSAFRLEFKNLHNIWNGQPGSMAKELKLVVLSPDGRHWQPVPVESLSGNRVQLSVHMPGPKLYVARVEPYRLSRWAMADWSGMALMLRCTNLTSTGLRG